MLDKFVVATDATIELIHILLKKSSVDFPLVSDSQSIVLFIYKLYIYLYVHRSCWSSRIPKT